MLTLSRGRWSASGASLGLAALLVGCVAVDTAPLTDANPDTQMRDGGVAAIALPIEPRVFEGIGPQFDPALDLGIPEGARSVSVEMTCEGSGGYTIEVGDTMASGLGVSIGTCADPQPFVYPITSDTRPTASVVVAAESAWTLSAIFSADEFVADSAVAADCAAFTSVYSALTNADQGLRFYGAFDEAEWTDRIDAARDSLDALASRAQSALAASFADLATAVSRDGISPGLALDGTDDPVLEISQACHSNHTPLIVLAEFGG